VSNAIGSNVFDILLGLGVPYLISVAMDGRLHLAEWVEEDCAWMEQGPLMIKVGDVTIEMLRSETEFFLWCCSPVRQTMSHNRCHVPCDELSQF
jgi:Ca2+/Na+ antiporter